MILVLEDPVTDPNSLMPRILYYADFVFTIVFAFEAVIKMVAQCVFSNPEPGEGA